MINKRAFLIDSTLVTNTEDMNIDDLFVIPLYAVIDDEPYKDFIEIDTETFYKKMLAGSKTSTSQPAVGEFVTMYEQIRDIGYTELFVFLISSELSGTYSTAVMAREMVEGIDIYLVDTKLSSAIGGVITKDIMQYAQKERTATEIVEYAEKSFAATKIAAYLSSLEALEKGGRISKLTARAGNLLQIKPILTLTQEGTFDLLAKERVESKAIKCAIESVMATERKVKSVVILHTVNKDLHEKMITLFEKHYPDVTYLEYDLSSVIGVHLGNEGVGIVVQYEI